MAGRINQPHGHWVSGVVVYFGRMNLNRMQFESAVTLGWERYMELAADYPELRLFPVFSRFGPRSGQCGVTTDLRKIVMEFPGMLTGVDSRERAQGNTKKLRDLLFEIKRVEKIGEGKELAGLREEADRVERRLLEPDLKLYCGDVNIELRCGILKYNSLRCLQRDMRLQPDANTIGNIRVIVGSIVYLALQTRR